MDILIMLIFPIHEYNMSLHLFVSSSLSSVSYNFLNRGLLYPWLTGFIPRYFILFETIVNGIVFLIFISISSLLAYKNATDFWILILYPATLMNSMTSSRSFLVESLGISMYSIKSSANKDSFPTSFIILKHFISSSCLIAVARTSSTMLKNRGENRKHF